MTGPLMLVSASYDNADKRVVLKFYDPESHKIVMWKDNTRHKPYCYSRLTGDELHEIRSMDRVTGISQVVLHDRAKDEPVGMSKITAADPFVISGTREKPGMKEQNRDVGIRHQVP